MSEYDAIRETIEEIRSICGDSVPVTKFELLDLKLRLAEHTYNTTKSQLENSDKLHRSYRNAIREHLEALKTGVIS